jgi:hypothetical protein
MLVVDARRATYKDYPRVARRGTLLPIVTAFLLSYCVAGTMRQSHVTGR